MNKIYEELNVEIRRLRKIADAAIESLPHAKGHVCNWPAVERLECMLAEYMMEKGGEIRPQRIQPSQEKYFLGEKVIVNESLIGTVVLQCTQRER